LVVPLLLFNAMCNKE